MLPSQSGRPSSSRSHMYRRTRRKRWPIIVAMMSIILGAGVVFKWWGGGADPAPAQGGVGPAVSPAEVEVPIQPTSQRRKSEAPPITKTGSQPESSQSLAINATLPPASKPIEKISMGGNAPIMGSTAAVSNPSTPTAPKPNDVAANTTPHHPAAVPPSVTSAPSTSTPTSQRLQAGLDLLAQNKPVEARSMLSAALQTPGISKADADRIRVELTKLNQRLIFGPEIVPNDPHVRQYVIEAGDSLAKLPRKLSLQVDWRFLQRINNISSPERIQVGQRVKVVNGPFHAVVHKYEFRMDVFMGDSAQRVYVRSFPVGLGEHGATPEGVFAVKENSKLIDPAWTNPRTGEFFASKDPKNPLGKYWIGLIGISDNIRDLETYGIHGTIEPDSIGQLRSMGCVRMLDDDVAMTYEMLIENVSQVEIHGEDYP